MAIIYPPYLNLDTYVVKFAAKTCIAAIVNNG